MSDAAQGLADRIYRRHGDASFTRFGEEGLIVVPRQSMNVVVNEVGLRVFELLDGHQSVGDLARRVADEYASGPSPDQMLLDVAELLDDLREKGAVELVSGELDD